ncbi:MAG: hypothetical protein FWD58_00210 [Firmicutes bacterium]|nr:hypothetical protein [Bacillota bacterium]
MNKQMCKAIAKKHSVSVEEIKKEMQAAIDAAYVFPTPEAMQIPRKGEIPTIDEFIEYVAKQVVAERNTDDKNGNDL